MRHTARAGALAVVGLASALILLFFRKIVFTNLILVGVDSFLYFYPYRAYVAQSLLDGRFPLWNPYLFLGAPLFANMQTAVLYPLHWPLLWLPVPQQVAVSIVLHVILAACGMLAYARRALRLSWLAALTAALVFALGGFLGAQAEHINQLNCIAWLPWAFLLVDRALGRWHSEGRGRRVLPLPSGLQSGGSGGGLPNHPKQEPTQADAHVQSWRSSFAARLAGAGTVFRQQAPITLMLALTIALMILAGHAQSVYICLAGLGLYALVRPAPSPRGFRGFSGVVQYAKQYPIGGLAVLMLAAGLAALLTAVQLLPTLELSGLSVRSDGLTYREATSFSLNPWLLHHTLLPPYGVDLSQVFGEAYGEYVAYVGIVGLGLALFAVWKCWRPVTAAPAASPFASEAGSVLGPQKKTGPDQLLPSARFFSLLAAGGLFLALGRINPVYYLLYQLVPGFDAFRAPARWMLLYAFGIAALAAIGLEWIRRPVRRERLAHGLAVALVIVLGGELFVAKDALRYSRPTAPEAFALLRPSVAHLKTDPGLQRFLSLSGIVYDPGDLAEMRAIFADQLPEQAIYDYVVAAKEKEVLFYNLPLLYGFYSVDGYDGGLLPLRDFVTMQRLFLPEDQLSPDGRLREKLRDVPPGRLLSLLGVKYVITDKVYDVWTDGVFYDLQFSARLSPGQEPRVESAELPDFPTTALGVISFLDGATALAQGTPAARISVADASGWSRTFDLLAGRDTSEGRYRQGIAHEQARVGHAWRDDPSGGDYIALIPLDSPRRLTHIVVEASLPTGQFVLRGLSLVDARTRTSQQLTLSTEGKYRLVHSGDVKIYENLAVLPRAFIVHQAEVLSEPDATLTRLRDPTFAPGSNVLLAEGQPLVGSGSGTVDITRYAPEEVTMEVSSNAPGYLVLTDTYYPGWEATVNGQPAPILRADLMFRAIQLPPGEHHVEFRYRPVSLRRGLGVSLLAVAAWLGALVWCLITRHAQLIPSAVPSRSSGRQSTPTGWRQR
jgi:hypothetical protein